ncbi:hypothetical protein VDT04_003488 [Vibrio cholerae]|nr:hypothetical protein [Vibrio cholerae]
MISCIYCSTEKFKEGQGSEEHAILSSLGGKKASRNICCQKCNNSLGDDIDKVVSEEFAFISNFANIKTGRKKAPKTIKSAGVMSDLEFELKPGGLPHFSKVKFESNEIDENSVQGSIVARSPEEAIRLVEAFAKKHGKSIDDVKDANIRLVSDYDIPKVQGTLKLGGEPFFRSITKMMLTYLATLCHHSRLRDGSFDEAIAYIKGDSNQELQVTHDYVSEYPKTELDNEISHLIFVFADPKTGVVFCGLRLFGYLQFSAKLTETWSGGEIKKCHQVDPVSGETLDFDLESLPVSINELALNMGNDSEKFEQAINSLMSAVFKAQQKAAIARTTEQAIEEAFAKQNFEDLTEDNLGEFVETIVGHVKAQMFRGTVTQEVSIEQLKRMKK